MVWMEPVGKCGTLFQCQQPAGLTARCPTYEQINSEPQHAGTTVLQTLLVWTWVHWASEELRPI
jgi:hypothetical protein